MIRMHLMLLLLVATMLGATTRAAEPPERPDLEALVAAQKSALAPLSWMDGQWRGAAVHTGANGAPHTVVQTERVGPMLDGAIKVIEGRGYSPEGGTVFNAFAVLYWDARRNTFLMRSNAMGMAGEYPLRLTADGFVWEIPAGPATLRYTATYKDGRWHEIGERIAEGAPAVRTFEMVLERVGESDWPAAGAVPMR